MISKLVKKAKKFATYQHGAIDHRRKYTNAPYIVHPEAVANIVKSVPFHTQEMIAAAWLHDTVEDTNTTLDDIRYLFGNTVHDLVETLTNIDKPSDGNREARHKINMAHMAKGSKDAKTIRLADIIDNCESIIKYDPKFAVTYLKEKADMLEVLTDGDPVLFAIARKIVYSLD